jgi:hypothetical protein
VRFADGATVLGTSTLDHGSATLAALLHAGAHQVTATYLGNGDLLPSSAGDFVDVAAATSATQVTSSPATVTVGDDVTLTATISGPPGVERAGTVSFATQYGPYHEFCASPLGPDGTATCTIKADTTFGIHLVASYRGAGDLGPSGTVVDLPVARAPSSIEAAPAQPSFVVGREATVLAKVTTSLQPDGWVQISDGVTQLGEAVVAVDGTATVTLPARLLHGGDHVLTASFSGASFVTSTTTFTLHVDRAPTVPGLQVIGGAGTVGQPVQVRDTILGGSLGHATGTITFSDAGEVLAVVPVDGIAASLSLHAGQRFVRADYSGSDDLLPSSGVLTIGVAQATSSTAVGVVGLARSDQPVLLQANVTGPNRGFAGTVTFFDGKRRLGTVAIATNGTGLISPRLGVGRHTITATFAGDGDHLGSVSRKTAVTVNKPPRRRRR